MNCSEVQKKIGFWMDKELPEDETTDLEYHLANCKKCSLEAGGLKCVSGLLYSYFAEPAPPPPRLKDKMMADFRKTHSKPTLLKRLNSNQFSWPMIPISIGGALVGLFLGALACEITILASGFLTQDSYIDALCSTGMAFGI